ncbi:hypothetical protein BE21_20005 [Sorangium cellulosum]|uniref:Uncharacterized protein n=1 Tax=Sorangium cellulosum TaxID=56 RepID=A0A150TWK9_SORCE|nr:hypothetical protein BE21_20005 [Sorangium cellulosum]
MHDRNGSIGRARFSASSAHGARGPFVSRAEASIAAACPFKGIGCFAEGKLAARRLTVDQLIADDGCLIGGALARRIPQHDARGGRDLQLHVGGDGGSAAGVRLLAGAEDRWRDRCRGAVWSFRHAWREVPCDAWGSNSVLASVEKPHDIEAARIAGDAATVVDEFPSDEAFSLLGANAKIVPCLAQKRSKTRVECRLCLDADELARRDIAIALEAHGPTARRVREAIVQQLVLIIQRSGAGGSRGR